MVKRILGRWSRQITAFIMVLLLGVSVLAPCEARGAEVLNPSVDEVLGSVSTYLLRTDTNPDFDSVWNVIGLVRSGVKVPESYLDTFYQNSVAYAKEKNWVLHRVKYTEYSKMIIGLTMIGKDARNIQGHNFLKDLSDFSLVKRQGVNGPIWALIALNSHPSYTIPANSAVKEQTTEEGLIQYILSNEIKTTGGWSLDGEKADSDMTGMAIQSLAPYYGKRQDVTAAVDRALSWLSSVQYLTSGGFGTLNNGEMIETAESGCQVIVALSSLGIDCAKDSRFVKNDKWPMTGLFRYYLPEGGFMHTAGDAGSNDQITGGVLNSMATYQGLYATAAYKRLLDGKTALYDGSDVNVIPDNSGSTNGSDGQTDTSKPGNGNDTTKPENGNDTTKPETPDGSTGSSSVTEPGTTTAKPEPTKPAAETRLKLRVSKLTTNGITLKWNKISGVKGYKIYRYHTGKKKYEPVASVSNRASSYTFKRLKGTKGDKLTAGTAYRLRVGAYTTVKGKTVYKKIETVTTATRPEKVSVSKLSKKSSKTARITWKREKRSNGYEVWMSGKKKTGYQRIKTTGSNKTTAYTKGKLKKGRTYYFKVRAYKKVGNTRIYGSFSKVKSIKMK